MSKRKEFRVDLHIHSMFSGESPTTPEEIVESAILNGLDGICITEHNSLYASAPFEKLKGKTGLAIFRGVELSTNAGHMLVYGIPDSRWNDWGAGQILEATEVIAKARELGGVAIPAHPWQLMKNTLEGSNSFLSPVVDESFCSLPGVVAIEVCNGKSIVFPLICEALGQVARTRHLGRTGGSDAHFAYQVGRSYTVFRKPISTLQELTDALLSLDYYPQNAF